MSPRRTTERDVPEADGRDGRQTRMSLRHEVETDGPSVLHVFPSWGYPSATFVLAFAVSKTDVPETDGAETDAPETHGAETDAPETDVPETDVPETEEGGDGGP